MPVNNLLDVHNFQRDLILFSKWCSKNDLSLNVSKCKHLSFYRKRIPHMVKLYINDEQLVSVNIIRDLGVLFTSKLTFDAHIDFSVSKAFSMLGFVKRICYNFNNIDCLKSIFFAHVRSHLEFACVVWSPDYDVHVTRIESIQKQFVLFALRRSVQRHNYVLPSYSFRCNILKIRSLSVRRDDISIMFVFDILTNKINSPDTLGKLNLLVPNRSLRSSVMFRIPFCRTNYSRSEPFNHMCRNFNAVCSLFDFNMSRLVFKNRILER